MFTLKKVPLIHIIAYIILSYVLTINFIYLQKQMIYCKKFFLSVNILCNYITNNN
jgi:hypothetical protein